MFRSKSSPITPVANASSKRSGTNSNEEILLDREDGRSTGTQTRVNSKHVHSLLYTRRQYKKLKTQLAEAVTAVRTIQYELQVLRALTTRRDVNRAFQDKRQRVASIVDDMQRTSQKTKYDDIQDRPGYFLPAKNDDNEFSRQQTMSKRILEDLGQKIQALREENERLNIALHFQESQARLESYSHSFAYSHNAIEDLLLGFAYVLGIHACDRQRAIEFSKQMLAKFVEENSWEGDDIIIWKGRRYIREGSV